MWFTYDLCGRQEFSLSQCLPPYLVQAPCWFSLALYLSHSSLCVNIELLEATFYDVNPTHACSKIDTCLLQCPLIFPFKMSLHDRVAFSRSGTCHHGFAPFRGGFVPIIRHHGCLTCHSFLDICFCAISSYWKQRIISYRCGCEDRRSQCWPPQWPSDPPIEQHVL